MAHSPKLFGPLRRSDFFCTDALASGPPTGRRPIWADAAHRGLRTRHADAGGRHALQAAGDEEAGVGLAEREHCRQREGQVRWMGLGPGQPSVWQRRASRALAGRRSAWRVGNSSPATRPCVADSLPSSPRALCRRAAACGAMRRGPRSGPRSGAYEPERYVERASFMDGCRLAEETKERHLSVFRVFPSEERQECATTNMVSTQCAAFSRNCEKSNRQGLSRWAFHKGVLTIQEGLISCPFTWEIHRISF